MERLRGGRTCAWLPRKSTLRSAVNLSLTMKMFLADSTLGWRIGVDFAFAKWQGANIPLHFNPRFHMDKLVLNTFQAGRWGDEQVHKMPFREGEHFEVIFIVTKTRYLLQLTWVNVPQMYLYCKFLFHHCHNANSYFGQGGKKIGVDEIKGLSLFICTYFDIFESDHPALLWGMLCILGKNKQGFFCKEIG
ncbi:Galectin-6, partial [Ophiophagus hannah]